jgi:siroheme synthase
VIVEREISPPALLVIGAVVAVHDVLQVAWAGGEG